MNNDNNDVFQKCLSKEWKESCTVFDINKLCFHFPSSIHPHLSPHLSSSSDILYLCPLPSCLVKEDKSFSSQDFFFINDQFFNPFLTKISSNWNEGIVNDLLFDLSNVYHQWICIVHQDGYQLQYKTPFTIHYYQIEMKSKCNKEIEMEWEEFQTKMENETAYPKEAVSMMCKYPISSIKQDGISVSFIAQWKETGMPSVLWKEPPPNANSTIVFHDISTTDNQEMMYNEGITWQMNLTKKCMQSMENMSWDDSSSPASSVQEALNELFQQPHRDDRSGENVTTELGTFTIYVLLYILLKYE